MRITGMAKRILVPVDGSEQATAACDLACELFSDGTLIFLHVINPADAGFSSEATIPSFPSSWYEQQHANAESIFDDLEADARAAGHDAERRIEAGQAIRTILDVTEEEAIDHIVMGSTGRQGVSRLLLGSVAEGVIRRSPVPVTIAR